MIKEEDISIAIKEGKEIHSGGTLDVRILAMEDMTSAEDMVKS